MTYNVSSGTLNTTIPYHTMDDTVYLNIALLGAVVQLVEHQTRNQEVAGLIHTRSTASNLEQVANLLCAQAHSASYPQRDGK